MRQNSDTLRLEKEINTQREREKGEAGAHGQRSASKTSGNEASTVMRERGQGGRGREKERGTQLGHACGHVTGELDLRSDKGYCSLLQVLQSVLWLFFTQQAKLLTS